MTVQSGALYFGRKQEREAQAIRVCVCKPSQQPAVQRRHLIPLQEKASPVSHCPWGASLSSVPPEVLIQPANSNTSARITAPDPCRPSLSAPCISGRYNAAQRNGGALGNTLVTTLHALRVIRLRQAVKQAVTERFSRACPTGHLSSLADPLYDALVTVA